MRQAVQISASDSLIGKRIGSERVRFLSTCPVCSEQQLQLAYTRRALLRCNRLANTPQCAIKGCQRCGSSSSRRLPDWVGSSLKDVFEVEIRIVAVEFGRLDQTHDDGSTLTGTQRAGKEPVGPAEGDWADPVFDVVVV